jgi:hypothetical protein
VSEHRFMVRCTFVVRVSPREHAYVFLHLDPDPAFTDSSSETSSWSYGWGGSDGATRMSAEQAVAFALQFEDMDGDTYAVVEAT